MAENENGDTSFGTLKKRKKIKYKKDEDETEIKISKLDQSQEEPNDDWTEDMDYSLVKFVEENCAQYQTSNKKPTLIFTKNLKWQIIANDFVAETGIRVDQNAVKNRWEVLTKRVRRIRTVPEVLEDVKKYISLHLDTYPKKPTSPYQLFCNSKRPRVHEKYPDMGFRDLNRNMAKKWKEFPAERKAKYEQKATAERQKYEEDVKEWQAIYPKAFTALNNEKKAVKTMLVVKKLSAFDVFSKKKLAEFATKHPDMDEAGLHEKIEKRWGKLKEHKREKYAEEAKISNNEPAKKASKKKLPLNAYKLYFVDQRPIIMTENPDISFGSLSKLMGQRWKEIDTEKSKLYHEKAKTLKEKYFEELATLEKNCPTL